MRLVDDLHAEHERIDRVLGAMRTWVARLARGEAARADGARFVRFFRLYADGYHHAREEGVLFAALVAEADLPRARGPIAVVTDDHRRLRALLGEIEGHLDAGAVTLLETLATSYTRSLWLHMDAEGSVLFPESVARLAHAGVRELEGRAATPDEAHAAEDGEALARAYPPTIDAEIVRGEGCVVCPHYGATCDGIEREWWNEHEWDELPDRLG